MDRTVLIANTSNMPVAAREASIYTGITLAEYYRDMGYHTAMMADSTSRWAEALREISGRLEEMPADEGFPAYLPSRLAEFYERAGYVQDAERCRRFRLRHRRCQPPGQRLLRACHPEHQAFHPLLLGAGQVPGLRPPLSGHQLERFSYSEYLGDLGRWYYDNVGHDFMSCRERVANLLLQENNLMEIVKLIGSDVLPDDQKLTIEIARVIRVGLPAAERFPRRATPMCRWKSS